MKPLIVIVTCFLFSNLAAASSKLPLLMCVDHYPPLQIILPDQTVTGENVEVAKQFLKPFPVSLKFTADTPFQRCIKWMEEGKVDVMVGLLGSEKRFRDFHMLLYDDLTKKRFFIRKNTLEINKFEDIKGLNIASLRGVSQFQEFDNRQGFFNKVEVTTLDAAFGMLLKGRVDAVISTENYGEQLLAHNTKFAENIEKSELLISEGTKTYIAFSKRAMSAKKLDMAPFVSHAQELFDSGEFASIIVNYQKDNPKHYE